MTAFGQKRTFDKFTIMIRGIPMQPRDEHMNHQVSKDPEREGPIPSVWRPTLKSIVDAFVRHDYGLLDKVPGVVPVLQETARQIREYIEDYGARLVPLPDDSWETSVCIWIEDHWDALVDLWTEEECRSDLVLQVHIRESNGGYSVTVHLVYVP